MKPLGIWKYLTPLSNDSEAEAMLHVDKEQRKAPLIGGANRKKLVQALAQARLTLAILMLKCSAV